MIKRDNTCRGHLAGGSTTDRARRRRGRWADDAVRWWRTWPAAA